MCPPGWGEVSMPADGVMSLRKRSALLKVQSKTEGVMRVAVIGAGRMGQVHARLLVGAKGVSGLLVADADVDKAKAVAKGLGADAAVDAAHAIESADAAIIATPAETQAFLVKAAVTKGCPVFCEKPFGENLSEARELATLVDSAGVLVRVGFQRRFDYGYHAARTAVLGNELGKLYLIRLQVTEQGLPPSPKTNLIRNTAIHDFDLLRWLSGEEVVSVYAAGAQRGTSEFDPRLDPDTIIVSVRLTNGVLAAVTVSRMSPLGYDIRAELVGSWDHVVVGWTGRTPVHSVERDSTTIGTNPWRSWQGRFEEAYRKQMCDFLDSVAGGNHSFGAGVSDAVKAHCIAEAVKLSLVRGEPVFLEVRS